MAKDPRNAMRRVQFPEGGQGVELYLPNKGMRALYVKLGEQWTQKVEFGLAMLNIDIIDLLLDQMGHENGEHKPILLDKLPDEVLMTELAEKLMDAFCLSMNGRTTEEQRAWLKTQKEAADAAENPPTTDQVDSQEHSSEEPIEQDLDLSSSTL